MTERAPSVLRSKLFWVGVLYFAQGLPFGIFFDVLPVWFRQQGVDLRDIGALSLLGLAWTLKFLWAPAVDHYRHHRLWMATADLAMGAVMLVIAAHAGLGPAVWFAATGETVGSFEPGRGVFSKPSIFENSIYFISGEGNIYGLRAQYEFKSSIYYLN